MINMSNCVQAMLEDTPVVGGNLSSEVWVEVLNYLWSDLWSPDGGEKLFRTNRTHTSLATDLTAWDLGYQTHASLRSEDALLKMSATLGGGAACGHVAHVQRAGWSLDGSEPKGG